MIDRTLGQEPAGREAGVAGPDDNGAVQLLYVLTDSTVTFTGFVSAS